MACRTGCPTKDHRNYAECARGIGINLTATPNNAWDRELNAYRSAKEQGISPAGTSMAKIRHAVEVSDRTGVAYNYETDAQ